ncbi:MAG: PQQ-dependent sugar dehydrogenase [Pyrinomonadaceae bacterium]
MSNTRRQSPRQAECFIAAACFPNSKTISFFGALKGKAIIRLVLDGRRIVSQEKLFVKTYGRVREIAEAPDGSIYFSTSNRDGRGDPTKEDDRILRIVPIADNLTK